MFYKVQIQLPYKPQWPPNSVITVFNIITGKANQKTLFYESNLALYSSPPLIYDHSLQRIPLLSDQISDVLISKILLNCPLSREAIPSRKATFPLQKGLDLQESDYCIVNINIKAISSSYQLIKQSQ